MSSENGKLIMLIGAIVMLIGALVYFLHDKLNWLGKLPGDIRIENENSRFYFPLTTCLLISGVISLILFIARKFFQ
jgi:hypothetical protein